MSMQTRATKSGLDVHRTSIGDTHTTAAYPQPHFTAQTSKYNLLRDLT